MLLRLQAFVFGFRESVVVNFLQDIVVRGDLASVVGFCDCVEKGVQSSG
ncbi:hypothetical protein [Planctomicrobium sp. SH527]